MGSIDDIEDKVSEPETAEVVKDEIAPEWVATLTSSIEELKSIIEDQRKTIDAQAQALDYSKAQMSKISDDFKTQTANLIQHGIPQASAQDVSEVNALLQPPKSDYTPMRDLDYLPADFREGKTPYTKAY